jgi:hypothetical protein
MSITIKGVTSGGVDLKAPDTGSNTTVTLPSATGTLLTEDGNGSALTGVGKVLQVVSSFTTTTLDITAAYDNATLATATIIPASSSSKILVLWSVIGYKASTTAETYNSTIKLRHVNLTTIAQVAPSIDYEKETNNRFAASGSYLYTLPNGNSTDLDIWHNGINSTATTYKYVMREITLIEIGA